MCVSGAAKYTPCDYTRAAVVEALVTPRVRLSSAVWSVIPLSPPTLSSVELSEAIQSELRGHISAYRESVGVRECPAVCAA